MDCTCTCTLYLIDASTVKVEVKVEAWEVLIHSCSIVTEQNDEKVSLSCKRALAIQGINHVNEL